jgi:hypothetical protein
MKFFSKPFSSYQRPTPTNWAELGADWKAGLHDPVFLLVLTTSLAAVVLTFLLT